MFKNRTVVVMGLNSPLSESLVFALWDRGATVIVLDLSREKIEAMRALAEKWGYRFRGIALDKMDYPHFLGALSKVKAMETPVDLWLNTYGTVSRSGFSNVTPEHLIQIWNKNVGLCYKVCQKAIALMEGQGKGTVVNFVSLLGHTSVPFMSAYVASQHALVGMVRSISSELKQLQSPVKSILVTVGMDSSTRSDASSCVVPPWLECLSEDPALTAKWILKKIEQGDQEIMASKLKLALKLSHLFPKLAPFAGKALLANQVSDLFFNRYQKA